MGAAELLHDLAEAGFSIEAEADRLVIRPWSRLTEHQLQALRRAKPELLALLSDPPRPYKLSKAQGDDAHAFAWDESTCARFTGRLGRFLRLGIDATDADDLAERLVLRDRTGDDRTMCCECSHYRPGRCGNHRHAGLQASGVGRDLAVMLQRCPGFKTQETMT